MSITADVDAALIELTKVIADYGYGDALSIINRSSGTYNADTGTSAVTETTYTTTGKLLDYRDSQFNGELVLWGDRKALFVPLARLWTPSVYKPVPGDIVTNGGSQKWNVVNVREIGFQNKKVAYVAQIRGTTGG